MFARHTAAFGRRIPNSIGNARFLASNGYSGVELISKSKSGIDLLNDPVYNKGTGFSIEERDRLGIRGLVPPKVLKQDERDAIQRQRVMSRYSRLASDVVKHVYLNNLKDRNEVLFYKVLCAHIEEMAPIIYTPTVGVACTRFSQMFRRPRGMYFSAEDRGQMHAMVYNYPVDDVECVVVTDGSRILGLGDLGANGMGIPIGKLSLYTACAGIAPSRTMPVLIDAGTNNPDNLKDPLYLGLQRKRYTGAEYDAIVDECISAIKTRWPKALIQFEDFSNENAMRLLQKYQHNTLCFNDDIQGTGAVALAGILGALRAIDHPEATLTKQRIVIAGAGTAGLGVANTIKHAMMKAGLSEDEARDNFWLLDAEGLLGQGRDAQPDQMAYVRGDLADGQSLEEVTAQVKPTVIIGVSGQGGLFSEETISTMAQHCKRPIVFPLSNPTTHAECTLENAVKWSQGSCIFASGSPFDPIEFEGKIHHANQANNMYTFPGLGLGAITCQSKRVSQDMLHACATTLAGLVDTDRLKVGKIFPRIRDIRPVTQEIAVSVVETARDTDLAQSPVPQTRDEVRELVEARTWQPEYAHIVRPAIESTAYVHAHAPHVN